MLVALPLQFVFQLVQHHHHVVFLLILGLNLPLSLFKALLKVLMLFSHFISLFFPLFDLTLFDEHAYNVSHVEVLQWSDIGVFSFVRLQNQLLDYPIQQHPVLERGAALLVGHHETVLQCRQQVRVRFSVAQMSLDHLKHLAGTFSFYMDSIKLFGHQKLVFIPQHLKEV